VRWIEARSFVMQKYQKKSRRQYFVSGGEEGWLRRMFLKVNTELRRNRKRAVPESHIKEEQVANLPEEETPSALDPWAGMIVCYTLSHLMARWDESSDVR
jgi:hypothetical protein